MKPDLQRIKQLHEKLQELESKGFNYYESKQQLLTEGFTEHEIMLAAAPAPIESKPLPEITPVYQSDEETTRKIGRELLDLDPTTTGTRGLMNRISYSWFDGIAFVVGIILLTIVATLLENAGIIAIEYRRTTEELEPFSFALTWMILAQVIFLIQRSENRRKDLEIIHRGALSTSSGKGFYARFWTGLCSLFLLYITVTVFYAATSR